MATRCVIAASLLCAWMAAAAQQAQGPARQPGPQWNQDQIRKVAHRVRAGRTLPSLSGRE